MIPVLIAILSDNKTVIYSIEGRGGKNILDAEIKGEIGNKYYCHKGVNYLLPAQFQGKAPICKL